MGTKAEVRKEKLLTRDSLNPQIWTVESGVIEKTLLRSRLFHDADCILLYSDYHGEVGTTLIFNEALIQGKEVYLPKCIDSFDTTGMDFYRVFSSYELVPGYKGIMEPLEDATKVFSYENAANKNILMLVPGVAFDKNGNRLGYGKGYYDRYLKDKERIVKCGLLFECQLTEEIPSEECDVKMDILITEKTALSDVDKIKYQKE